MSLLLDSAALVALERNQRPMWVRLKAAVAAGDVPLTHGGVLAQVWRGGGRQARLARALRGIDIRPIDRALARAAGELLGRARTSDIVDAALMALAVDGDEIFTSDLDDLAQLAAAAGRHVELVRP